MKRSLTFFSLLLVSTLALAQTPAPSSNNQPQTDLLFIIDSSGSMQSLLEGERMIDWAKKAISNAVSNLPAEAEVGLRVYAHRVEKTNREASCKDTELLVPIGAGSSAKIVQSLPSLQPKGWTPIAYSLEQAAFDFLEYKERLHSIILLSDGEETCGGDPRAAVQALIQKGFKVKIYTIGFNVDAKGRAQLESLAQEFGGTYSDVRSGIALQEELKKLTEQSFLIEKKEIENRIRGGNDFASAIPIEIGKRYLLDHHQRKGQYDYFSVKLKPGQRVFLNVQAAPKCLAVVGDQAQEKSEDTSCGTDEAFRVALFDAGQKEVIRASSNLVNRSFETNVVEVPSDSQGLYYLLVGSPIVDMHRDHAFSVSVQESMGDANSGKDAGDSLSTALFIAPGLYENNRVSDVDLVDTFKFTLPAGSIFKVVATAVKREEIVSDMSLEVLGELGEVLQEDAYVEEGESSVYELGEVSNQAKNFYLRVKYNDTRRGSFVYSLAVALKSGGEVAPTTPPAEGAPTETKEEGLETTQASFPPWLGFALLAFILFAAIYLFFVLRKKVSIPLLPRILGWYEIAASVVGVIFAVWLFSKESSLVMQIVMVSMCLAIGVVGILGGGNLLLNKKPRLSFVWGWLQLPWVYLNLHWVVLKYVCTFLLGFPVYFIFDTSQTPPAHLHFQFQLGLLFGAFARFSWPGYDFGIGFGINIAALIFLILLFFCTRKKTIE